MTETREPEYRDDGDHERLRDQVPEWFEKLERDRPDGDPENGTDD
jgi:hypothetical protein